MSYATLADGSLLPKSTDQSPKSQFSAGKIQTVGNIIYGYSGMVDFDVTAAATYPLLRFTSERNAMISVQFSADYDLLASTSIAIGFRTSIDGVNVILWSHDNVGGSGQTIGPNPPEWQFFLPAGRDCNMVVLNPDAGATLCQSNIVIKGQYV